MKNLYQIHPSDNVAVNLETGFKEALTDIPAGSPVIKYGNPIGRASKDIKKGETVHTGNMETALREREEYTWRGGASGVKDCMEYAEKHREECAETSGDPVGRVPDQEWFLGFRREDGRVGIRNELWVIPTVGCVNTVASRIAELAGGIAFPHPAGCSQLGDDLKRTQLILRGLVLNPNAGGVLLVGLGCENNTMESFLPLVSGKDPKRIRVLICQETEDEIAEGVRLSGELLANMERDRREAYPLSELSVGLKCGGSDGFSGVTANPLVGRFTDRLVQAGGSAVLTEVPEMFGAEQLLMDRAVSEKVFSDTVDLINGYKDYYIRYGQPVYENPSPGNLAGGITTLEDKSLGCTQKSGSVPVSGVLRYGNTVPGPGLYLLEGPGNDMVACTNLAAAGCVLILFTTGRGTPLGSPVPVIKIASNRALAERKRNWTDFDASDVLSEKEAADARLLETVLAVSSGAETANERNGAREIALFRDGVIL